MSGRQEETGWRNDENNGRSSYPCHHGWGKLPESGGTSPQQGGYFCDSEVLLFLSEEKYRIPAGGGDARNVSYTAKKIAPEYGIDYRTLSLRFIRMVTMEELSDADSIPWKSTGSWFTR